MRRFDQKSLGLWAVAPLLLLASTAWAVNDGGTGISTSYNRFWGDQTARNGIESCDFTALDDSSNGGFVNVGNSILCRLSVTLGISGATGTSGVTGSYAPVGTTGMTAYLHAVVSGSPGTAGFSGFDYLAEVWSCVDGGSTDCTNLANFSRYARFKWTKSGVNGEINLGNASIAGDYAITWDLGKSTGSRYLEAKIALSNVNWYGRNDSTDTLINSTFVQTYLPGGAPSFRWRQNFNLTTNDVGYARTLVMNLTDVTKNDAPTYGCATRVRQETDWQYTIVGGGVCPSVSIPNYPSYSVADVAAFTSGNIGFTWGTMTLHPANL